MRFWILAMAALLGITDLAAHGDYVIIKVDLAARRERLDDTVQPGAPQVPGVPGAPGGPGMMNPGQMGGQMGALQGGMRPGFQGPGGGFQGPGAPGAGGQGQGFGMRPGQVPGQGGPMGPAGMMRGQGGMGGQFGRGMQGMMPGGQGMMPGMQRQMTTSPPGQEEDDEFDSSPLIVRAIIEADHTAIKNVRDVLKQKTGRYEIHHKWGRTITYFSPGEISVTFRSMKTVAQRFTDQKNLIKAEDPDRADKLIKLARWALAHGLVDKVDTIMEELEKIDPKNHIVATFNKVRDGLNRDVTGLDPGVSWRDRLGDFTATNSKHYVLISDAKTAKEAQTRLDLLERNMSGFYYWFALRGKALPVPKYRLVTALEASPDSLQRHRRDIFDDAEMVADGFYVPRDNLAILSNERLDEGYAALEKTSSPYWKTWSQEQLFEEHPRSSKSYSANEKARAETFALLLKAQREEADLATISHEGTRQLIVASGLLPASVVAPAWLDFGIPSFFETPKGSYWPGFGESHILYHTNFKRWRDPKSKNALPDAVAALKAVITDEYFHKAQQGKFKESKDKEAALARARTTAWALGFYLASSKLDGLLKYYQEISRMPRDLPIDADSLVLLFARAFNLVEASNPNQIDENAFGNFANAWYYFMDRTPLEIEERDSSSKKEAEVKAASKP